MTFGPFQGERPSAEGSTALGREWPLRPADSCHVAARGSFIASSRVAQRVARRPWSCASPRVHEHERSARMVLRSFPAQRPVTEHPAGRRPDASRASSTRSMMSAFTRTRRFHADALRAELALSLRTGSPLARALCGIMRPRSPTSVAITHRAVRPRSSLPSARATNGYRANASSAAATHGALPPFAYLRFEIERAGRGGAVADSGVYRNDLCQVLHFDESVTSL